MAHEAAAKKPTTWRSIYPVHPCADVFPMLDDAKLAELAQDIKQNGLRHSIVLAAGPHPSVLDGQESTRGIRTLRHCAARR